MQLYSSYWLIVIFACIFLFLIVRFITDRPETKRTMKRFLDKAKAVLHDDDDSSSNHASVHPQQQPISTPPIAMPPPSLADVTRHRYHHGTNLGSVFIMERWITGSMYHEKAQGSSERSAVKSWVKAEGHDAARARFERHWREYVSDADLNWLRDVARCTTVRLPIGYFTLGKQFCKGTAFEDHADVYAGAWQAVKDLVARCAQRGIGVLVDLHGLPGGANPNDHSGTDSGKVELWASKDNRGLATRCLTFIAREACTMPGVAGLQLINEAEHDAPGMYDWYANVLAQLSSIDASLPVYISDGWDLTRAVLWSRAHNSPGVPAANPVVVDTHLYWCFSEADVHKSPQQICSEPHTALTPLDAHAGSVADRGAAQAIVGEYSCVMAPQSWAQKGSDDKDALVRAFGNAQCQRFQARAGGAFFWTGRMDWMPGGEWGFRAMTELGAIHAPEVLKLAACDVRGRLAMADSQHDALRSRTVAAHCGYWDSQHPGTAFEHWRFETGWDVGWGDARAFFACRVEHGWEGADGVGMLDLWCLKRIREHVALRGWGLVWEFEQGVRQGVRDFGEGAV